MHNNKFLLLLFDFKMEHVYKYRDEYGINFEEEKVGDVPPRPQIIVLEERDFFSKDPVHDVPFREKSLAIFLWIYRHFRNAISTTSHEIAGELKSIPSLIKRTFKNFSFKNFANACLELCTRDFVEMREVFRPIFYALKTAYKDMDQLSRVYLWTLSTVTVYFLWKNQAYIRHRKNGELNVKDLVIVITGGNSGIGERLAYELVERGAYVIIVGSDITRTLQVAYNMHRYIARMVGTPSYDYETTLHKPNSHTFLVPTPFNQHTRMEELQRVQWLEMDLADSRSIYRGVYNIFQVFGHVDILINNAAIQLPPKEKDEENDEVNHFSPEGIEAHFSVNYLGHFMLTNLIISFMNNPPIRPFKIINVVCRQAFSEGVLTFSEMLEGCRNDGIFKKPYATSKYLNFLFHAELTKRLRDANLQDFIRTYAVCPPICQTNLKRYFPPDTFSSWIPQRSADAGAQTIIHCALSSKCEAQTGLFYEHCDVSTPPIPCGRNYIEFAKLCQRLWEITTENTKQVIDYYKENDVPLQKGDNYGNVVFKDNEFIDEENRDWFPEPERKLTSFRNFYTPVFEKQPFYNEWKESICKKNLVDIYVDINGPLSFKPRRANHSVNQDDFDPIYDRPPVFIKMNNGTWMY